MNARRLLEEIRKRPLIVVGGLVALFAIANLSDLFGRGQATDEPTDPQADPGTGTDTADPAAAAGYTDPYGYTSPSYPTSPAYDPFVNDPGTNQPTIDYSPEGCPLPRPAAPDLYKDQGEYVCDGATKQWVWKWKPAKVSQGGCLLPKPTPPAAYIGRGEYVCDTTSKQWVWKWKPATPPPAKKPARLVLKAGTHQTFSVNTSVTPKKASDARQWQHGAVTVETSGKAAVRLPSGSTVELVQIKTGGQAKRWIRPTAGAWSPATGG